MYNRLRDVLGVNTEQRIDQLFDARSLRFHYALIDYLARFDNCSKTTYYLTVKPKPLFRYSHINKKKRKRKVMQQKQSRSKNRR